jgi:beta-alanine--pyruvate transaminase
LRPRQPYARGEPEIGADLADGLSCIVALDGAASIAAVIIEPMLGSAGVFASPQGYLQRLQEITRAHGILFILNEVITGFGRLGYAFAAERYGIVPDMICFAKAVTNGAAPLGGVLVRNHIHAAFMQGPDHVPELAHGFTNSGHPLSVAAASAALEIYRDEGLFERANALEGDLCRRSAWPQRGRARHGHQDDRPRRRHRSRSDRRLAGLARRAGARCLFFDEDLALRVVGYTIVLAPALVASEDDIAAIVGRVAEMLKRLR